MKERVQGNSGNLNNYVVNENTLKQQAQDAKRREYISNNEYAQKLEELLAYLKRREDAMKLGIKEPEYSGKTEESVLLQLNYDKTKLLNKERIFIPYFEEIERYGGRLGDNIPQDILDIYENYKNENGENSEKIMASGILMLNFLGIDLLEKFEKDGSWSLKKLSIDDLYSASLLINSRGELNILNELPEEYKNLLFLGMFLGTPSENILIK